MSESVTERLLGTTAVYEIVKRQGDLVELEVIRSPGLDPGKHVVFTSEAVSRMRKWGTDGDHAEARA